ncbi:putative ATP-dependent carboligase [Methylomicrobium album BG8]|uniref:Putative ATP-dependent carboligase n=1 Tax=Methylomicrobium album BG8 TaxID=686340 RepID=H8GG93_METAL|nr:putative ATP-dependent carboligase [Methylomicrobium album BG8]
MGPAQHLNSSDFLLIIAGSGRILAESACKAGLKALVIDLYADLDTREYAFEVCRLPSLAIEEVAPVLDGLVGRYGVGRAVYGSGVEPYPETLDYLDRRMTLLGNAPAVFRRLQDKAAFFAVLADLRIPFPAVSFVAPDSDGGGWLVKPMQGQGGLGIRRYSSGLADRGVYWQKFQAGTPGSVLFLADTHKACVVGFHTQFHADLSAGLEFAFSGLINHAILSAGQKVQLAGWLSQCARAFGLKGLNTLDFIQDGERIYGLEINPRPSASMQCYGELLTCHIAACQGALPEALPAQKGFAGFRIVYADRDLRIPEGLVWPEWVMDRPEVGALCHAGQPVCSVISRRSDPERVEAELAARQQQIFNRLIKV